MKIGICNDHAGVEYKNIIMGILSERGIEVINFGTNTEESMDYPDVAHPLAQAVASKTVDKGIALCGTGNGMALTLNKYPEIRATLAWNLEVAKLVKQHNDANILVLPARFLSKEEVSPIVNMWLDSEFEGGRHNIRLAKVVR